MSAAKPKLQPSRQSRAQRTDELIRRAALELLAEEGYSALAFTRISERAGVSRRPVHDRYGNRTEIAMDLWRNIAQDHLGDDLLKLFATFESEDRSPDRFVEAMQRYLTPTEELLGAIEILVITQFDMRLRTMIAESAAAVFEPMIEHDGSDAAIRKATKRAYVASFALGLLLVARLPSSEPLDISPDARRLYDSLMLDAEMVALPELAEPMFDDVTSFESGDAMLDALLQAVIDEVSEVGFDGATTMRIARRAGASEGYLFSKYDSKLDLFVDAVKRKSDIRLKVNNEKSAAIAQDHGQPVADALMIVESMHPSSPRRRSIALERMRIAMHNADMRRAHAESLENFVASVREQDPDWAARMTLSRARFGYAVGVGVAAVPLLMPSAWQLPFDITTRAFAD